jgi:hypothetical protein
MRDLTRDLNCSLSYNPVLFNCIFNRHKVAFAVSRLKCHKSDNSASLSSDHIINAGADFMAYLALLFTALSVHSTAPDSFHFSAIVPIPKGHNTDKSDSSNCRGIALSSVFGKVFDNIILDWYSALLQSSYLPFGFKAGCSTNDCTMMLKETLAYYAHNQTPTFARSLI